MSGLPAFPTAAMRPPFRPTSALTIPQWSRISALVITVSTAPAAVPGLRREIAHAALVVGRSLRGGNERGGRILHVDVDDGVDDLVAPRLVQAGLQPLVERSGWNQGGKIVDGFHQRIDAARRVVILPQAVA